MMMIDAPAIAAPAPASPCPPTRRTAWSNRAEARPCAAGGNGLYTSGAGPGTKGLTMFLVPLDLPGLSIASLNDMGCRSMGRAIINFEDVKVPAKYRIGEEGQAFGKQFSGHVDQGTTTVTRIDSSTGLDQVI